MSQKKVRFAVVGVRGLGRAHIEGIRKNSDVAELVAICDNDAEILNVRGDEYGVEKRYVDFYEMLKEGGFDCVILVTPDQIHREHAVAACEAGYGGCIIGSGNEQTIASILSLPEHLSVALVLGLGVPEETVVLTEAVDGQVKYYRDENDTHFVPKRPLDEIIIK